MEYPFANGLYKEGLGRLHGASSCPITMFKVVYRVFGSFHGCSDVTGFFGMCDGVHLALLGHTLSCFSESIIQYSLLARPRVCTEAAAGEEGSSMSVSFLCPAAPLLHCSLSA
jgi:hypothetical protein